ncbi:hypothetical protein BDP55DRAFT_192580 [Colletotrichum godetiae]|uniref:Uncharacterized protein n=1 Tax=Colletotrichum godetiae TaxID=1209918 RepID=A0AAJ0ERF2_9PEZI|nr:uncharacterized protein BDP55DRAFT_192580 [Colletotrichum godetiae]KAK1673851.1 hypothetical protein BDP55DRAFT_192580 [Colletotrichum godetiae]
MLSSHLHLIPSLVWVGLARFRSDTRLTSLAAQKKTKRQQAKPRGVWTPSWARWSGWWSGPDYPSNGLGAREAQAAYTNKSPVSAHGPELPATSLPAPLPFPSCRRRLRTDGRACSSINSRGLPHQTASLLAGTSSSVLISCSSTYLTSYEPFLDVKPPERSSSFPAAAPPSVRRSPGSSLQVLPRVSSCRDPPLDLFLLPVHPLHRSRCEIDGTVGKSTDPSRGAEKFRIPSTQPYEPMTFTTTIIPGRISGNPPDPKKEEQENPQRSWCGPPAAADQRYFQTKTKKKAQSRFWIPRSRPSWIVEHTRSSLRRRKKEGWSRPFRTSLSGTPAHQTTRRHTAGPRPHPSTIPSIPSPIPCGGALPYRTVPQPQQPHRHHHPLPKSFPPAHCASYPHGSGRVLLRTPLRSGVNLSLGSHCGQEISVFSISRASWYLVAAPSTPYTPYTVEAYGRTLFHLSGSW